MIQKIFISVFTIIIIFGQNISDNRIRYAERHLPREYNPNASGNKRTREDFRLYSLYHEKIFENIGGNYLPNFTYSQKTKGDLLKYVYMIKKDDLSSSFKSEFVMEFPKQNAQKFKFHNGRAVTASDIVYSIKYAIEKKIIDNSIFKPENVFLDKDGNLRIRFNYALVLKTVVQYLGSVFVLPAPEIYPPYTIVEDLKNKGAGPFRIQVAKDEEIILSFFNDYPTKSLFDGILIKEIPKRLTMIDELRSTNQLNLILDMPYTMLGDYFPGYKRQKIPRLSICSLWIDYTNIHLGNKETGQKFREALSIALDRTDIVYNGMHNDGVPLNGPFPLGSNYHPGQINPTQFNLKRAKDIFKRLPGYSYNEKGDLLFKGNQVRLILVYQGDIFRNEITAMLTLKSNLNSVGIILRLSPQPNSKELLKDPVKWDLIYWKLFPHPASVLEEIYSSSGGNNYQHYSNMEVDNLYREFNTAVAVRRKNEIGKNIYHKLKKDNASIFLWSLYDWYEYNSREIHEDVEDKIDGEAFFSVPHLWRPTNK